MGVHPHNASEYTDEVEAMILEAMKHVSGTFEPSTTTRLIQETAAMRRMGRDRAGLPLRQLATSHSAGNPDTTAEAGCAVEQAHHDTYQRSRRGYLADTERKPAEGAETAYTLLYRHARTCCQTAVTLSELLDRRYWCVCACQNGLRA
jgi:hypothetical protein